MNDLEKLTIANCKIQLSIAKRKLEVCKKSKHNTRHIQAELIQAEIDFLTEFIESYN